MVAAIFHRNNASFKKETQWVNQKERGYIFIFLIVEKMNVLYVNTFCHVKEKTSKWIMNNINVNADNLF